MGTNTRSTRVSGTTVEWHASQAFDHAQALARGEVPAEELFCTYRLVAAHMEAVVDGLYDMWHSHQGSDSR